MDFKPGKKKLANKIANILEDPSASEYLLKRFAKLNEANDGFTVSLKSEVQSKLEYDWSCYHHDDGLPNTIDVEYTYYFLEVTRYGSSIKKIEISNKESIIDALLTTPKS
jgi:hypothetical protein